MNLNPRIAGLLLAAVAALALLSQPEASDRKPDKPRPKPQPEPRWTVEQAEQTITATDMQAVLTPLADRPRPAGSAEYDAAAEYMVACCQQWGINVERQTVSSNAGDNVIAWIDGRQDPSRVYVVGAHLDTVPPSPGADDNGSGSVAVLELAEAFSKVKDQIPYTISMQWYTAEERGMVGSEYYCDHPTLPKSGPNIKAHAFMWNFDMIGRLRGGSVEGCIRHNTSSSSDQSSFRAKSVPNDWYFTGTHADYHGRGDTPEKCDYAGMQEIVRHCYRDVWQKMRGGHTETVPPLKEQVPWLDHGVTPFVR